MTDYRKNPKHISTKNLAKIKSSDIKNLSTEQLSAILNVQTNRAIRTRRKDLRAIQKSQTGHIPSAYREWDDSAIKQFNEKRKYGFGDFSSYKDMDFKKDEGQMSRNEIISRLRVVNNFLSAKTIRLTPQENDEQFNKFKKEIKNRVLEGGGKEADQTWTATDEQNLWDMYRDVTNYFDNKGDYYRPSDVIAAIMEIIENEKSYKSTGTLARAVKQKIDKFYRIRSSRDERDFTGSGFGGGKNSNKW